MPGSDDGMGGLATSALGTAATGLETPTSTVSFNTPMPTPRTPGAPLFTGKYVQDFLDTLEGFAEGAGIDHSRLPGYVLRYCHDRVRPLLQDAAVFAGNDWAMTSAFLVKYYGSNDRVIEQSPDRLRRWCDIHSKDGSIRDVKDISKYQREFRLLSSNLVSDGEMVQREINLLFWRGLPETIKPQLKKKLPVANQDRKAPPTIDETVALLTKFFEKQDLDDDLPDLPLNIEAQSDEENDFTDVLVRTKLSKKVAFELPTQKTVKAVPVTDPAIEELTKQIELLKLTNAQLRRSQNIPPVDNFPDVQRNSQRCMMCGGRHPDRPPGPRFCPETQKLVHEGYIQIGVGGRISMLDGTDLPRAHDLEGGVAQALRERRAARGKGREDRDRPPHLAAFAGLQYNGDNYDAYDHDPAYNPTYDATYDYDIGAVSASTQSSAWRAFAHPAVRTQKDDQRHDPKKRPAKKAPVPAPTLPHPDDLNANPHLTRKRAHLEKPETTAPGPTRPQNQSFHPSARSEPTPGPSNEPSGSNNVPRPPPVNTEQAFKNNRKRVPPNPPRNPPEIEMRDGTKAAPKNTAGYHFTSSVQEMVDLDSIQEKILAATINISVRDLLGCSPELQRRLANLTRTRREYTDKTVMVQYVEQVDDLDEEDEDGYDSDAEDAAYASAFMATYDKNDQVNYADAEGMIHSRVDMSFDGSQDTEESVLERYAHAVKVHREPVPLFAMVTGRFNGRFAGVDVSFMIDTGSELNLVSRDVYAGTGLPIDLDGTKWSLKGINGNPVPLGGCVRDVPILLNGQRFDHHFFCSSEGLGCGKASVILGQPWLQWYEAGINYTRRGLMWMKIWKNGRDLGRRPDLAIALSQPGAPRNATSLTPDAPSPLQNHEKTKPNRKKSTRPPWIEEASDSDEYSTSTPGK